MQLDKQHRNDQMAQLAEIEEDRPRKRPVAQPDRELPHRSEMERAFGTDLGDVGVKVGARLGGERALAGPGSVAFAEQSPDRKVVAHEVAHVLQQRGGPAPATDVERNAGEIAMRADRGEQVGHLVQSASGPAQIHAYSEQAIEGTDMRVSDTGKSMVSQDGGAGGQTLYLTDDLLANANAKLGEAGPKGSFIRLAKTGATHKSGDNTLQQVLPRFTNVGKDPDNDKLTKANSGGKDDDGKKSAKMMALWAQCGRSSKTVMGTDDYGDAAHAQYNLDGKSEFTEQRSGGPSVFSDEIYVKALPGFLRDPANAKYLKEGVHYTGDKTNLIPIDGNPTEARRQYYELGEQGRLKFSRQVGINEGANPEIGGAYTMATEYDMPGFKPVNPDFTWNFHWAGVVAKDGGDNITLENYAIMFEPTGDAKKDEENAERAYDWANRDWVYQMYGTVKKGQTFQEQHLATGTHANRASTFAAKVD